VNQLALLPAAAPAPAGAAPAITPAAAGPVPLVIGLDLALVLSGIAGLGWTQHINSGTLRAEQRLDHVVQTAASYYRNADFVTLEGPSYGNALQAGHDELAALRWMVRRDLWKRGIPYAVIPPSGRIIFALGNARPKDPATGKPVTAKQSKAMVRDAVAAQYGIECEGRARYDQADAYVLLAMGLAHLGHPQAQLPDTHTRALTGVNWPERTDT
jgi:hypothetical protein